MVVSERTARVIVVEDDPELRRSLGRLIESVGLDSRLYASADELLKDYDPDVPGCVVLDVRLPGLSGLELQSRLAGRGGRHPFIIITGFGDVPTAVAAMRSGAIDFIEKPFHHQLLLDRINAAIEIDARQRRVQAFRRDVLNRFQSLTPREADVMRLIVEGLSNKEIALRLGISRKTTEVHRARLMAKMQAESVVQLVHLAAQLPLADIQPRGPLVNDLTQARAC